MIDVETQWMIFLLIAGVAVAQILAIVSGWIFDYRERRRIKRIFSERHPGEPT